MDQLGKFVNIQWSYTPFLSTPFKPGNDDDEVMIKKSYLNQLKIVQQVGIG